MTNEFDNPNPQPLERVTFQPGEMPFRMRIGHSITVLVAICCLGGIALSLFVGIGYRKLDMESMQLEQEAQFLPLLNGTQAEIQAWLVSCDLALKSGLPEFIEPAAEHADHLHKAVKSLQYSRLYNFTGDQFALLKDLKDEVLIIQDMLFQRGAGDEYAQISDSVLATLEEQKHAIRATIGSLVSSIMMERDIASSMLDISRDRFDRAVFLVAAIYIMIVLIVWTRTALTTIFPIKQLTTVATRALHEGAAFHPPEQSPPEIKVLSDTLASFIDKLEERVRERTKELEHQKTDLEKHIAERQRLERRARNMALFVQVNPAPILRINAAGNILMTNPATERLFERDSIDLLGVNISDLLPVLSDVNIAKLVENGQSIERRVKVNDSHFQFIFAGVPELRAVHVYSHDISEGVRAETANRELEAQLRQTQRLETIGTLAGGIAHDFNNILTPILGYAEIALHSSGGDNRRQDLEQVIRAAHRAKDLVNQILTFSRQSDQERKPVELHLIVKEALKLIRASIPKFIAIQDNVHKNCGTVLADPSQLHQVVMNLCTNSYHAMREQGKGTLEVSLVGVEIDTDDLNNNPGLQEGKYVKLVVRDTGSGMDEVTRDRIFEPFFTTKDVGEGTGLGLSVVHGIITKHGGTIQVESELGEGTAFTIMLPAATAEEQSVVPSKQEIPMGTESILLVDDEPEIVSMAEDMLSMLGYQVAGRTNGIEAFEAVRANLDKYDLIITDHNMPGLMGLDLAAKVRDLRDDLPVILITGYSENVNQKTCDANGICSLLMKPLVMAELARAVREALDAAALLRDTIA